MLLKTAIKKSYGSLCYKPIVTSHNPIGIEHGDELKDKHPAQHLRPWVLLIQNEVQEAIEHKAGGCLPRMHPAADEKYLHRYIDTELQLTYKE